MSRAIPDPLETYEVWQEGNSIQRMARQVVPAPLLVGAPYGHIDVLTALRLGEAQNALYGPNLVTNPLFLTDSDWTKGPGWTISGDGSAESDGTVGTLSQTVAITPGTDYLVRVESKGTYVGLGVILGGVTPQETITVEGNETFVITAAIGASVIGLSVAILNNFIGKVTRVTVREIL